MFVWRFQLFIKTKCSPTPWPNDLNQIALITYNLYIILNYHSRIEYIINNKIYLILLIFLNIYYVHMDNNIMHRRWISIIGTKKPFFCCTQRPFLLYIQYTHVHNVRSSGVKLYLLYL